MKKISKMKNFLLKESEIKRKKDYPPNTDLKKLLQYIYLFVYLHTSIYQTVITN